MKKTNQNKASFREKMETETYNNFYFNNLTLDKKGNVISRKKRVNDTKMIDALLSYKSKLKLTLKQYRFLMMMRVKDTCTPKQRNWIEELSKKQKQL